MDGLVAAQGAVDHRPRGRAAVTALALLAGLELVTAVVGTVALGWSWQEAMDAFVVTNATMGAAFSVSGALITWHRSRNPIGWLFLAAGVAFSTSAAMVPIATQLNSTGTSPGLLRLALTVFVWSWPWAIGLCLPLALLLFPDGRPASRRWRFVVRAELVAGPIFVVSMATSPKPIDGFPVGYLTLDGYDRLAPVWAAASFAVLSVYVLSVVSLAVRYRNSGELERRQLLWLLLACLLVLPVLAVWGNVAGLPTAVLLSIALIPAAVTVAIVRHELFDIRLVVSRALAWTLASAGVATGYLLLVAGLQQQVSGREGPSAIATVAVALAAAPTLPRLQGFVDRRMYGDRRDPAGVASRVGTQLTVGVDAGLPAVVEAVCSELRLPYVAVRSGADLVEAGTLTGPVRELPLDFAGGRVGELLLGLRPGERELSEPDRRVLTLLASPLAVALHATALSTQLQLSRERLVAAREEERRRLQRDLHDELGATLTGVALSADAAANLLDVDPVSARQLLVSLCADTRGALADVRRLIEDLRPPTLDEYGLVGALRQRAQAIGRRADGTPLRVVVQAHDELPVLPAAVEVTGYRVVTEALTNVVKHSSATTATVTVGVVDDLAATAQLLIEVRDDGRPSEPWSGGVGLGAMRERVSELGGTVVAGPSADGGLVRATLPMPKVGVAP